MIEIIKAYLLAAYYIIYVCRKLIIIVYLIFAILGFIGEAFTNFRETRTAIHSLNFKEHFVVEKLYVDESYQVDIYDIYDIKGHFKNEEKNSHFIHNIYEDIYDEFKEYDKEENNIYYEVWYDKETGRVFLKTSDELGIHIDGFVFILMWIFIIPSIYYLRKTIKKEKLEKKEHKS